MKVDEAAVMRGKAMLLVGGVGAPPTKEQAIVACLVGGAIQALSEACEIKPKVLFTQLLLGLQADIEGPEAFAAADAACGLLEALEACGRTWEVKKPVPSGKVS